MFALCHCIYIQSKFNYLIFSIKFQCVTKLKKILICIGLNYRIKHRLNEDVNSTTDNIEGEINLVAHVKELGEAAPQRKMGGVHYPSTLV